jgi:hypothetical protein
MDVEPLSEFLLRQQTACTQSIVEVDPIVRTKSGAA